MISPEKKCSCFTAEIGTTVFAIINAIVVTVSCLFSVIGLIYWIVALLAVSDELEVNDYKYAGYVLPALFGRGIGIIFGMFSSFVAMVFAVFLLHGIVKKNPHHLKAYFIYGVVVNVLSLSAVLVYLAFLSFIIAGWGQYMSIGVQLVPVAVVIMFCFIYSLILAMIRVTYRKIQSQNLQYKHQLIETQKF